MLHEAQNIEAFNLAVREKAVDGIGLFAKHFENRMQPRQRQQFHVPLIQVEQLQRAAGLFTCV